MAVPGASACVPVCEHIHTEALGRGVRAMWVENEESGHVFLWFDEALRHNWRKPY